MNAFTSVTEKLSSLFSLFSGGGAPPEDPGGPRSNSLERPSLNNSFTLNSQDDDYFPHSRNSYKGGKPRINFYGPSAAVAFQAR